MANRRNAIIEIRKDKRKTFINKISKTEIRTLLKNFDKTCISNKLDEAKAQSKNLFSKLDKAIKKGLLNESLVNRKKSQISKKLSLIKG